MNPIHQNYREAELRDYAEERYREARVSTALDTIQALATDDELNAAIQTLKTVQMDRDERRGRLGKMLAEVPF